MDTIHHYYQVAEARLAALYEPSESREIARRLLEDALGWSRTQLLIAEGTTALSPAVQERLDQQLLELEAERPLQYILERAPFLAHELYVAPGVLIPRPETEELVALILEQMPHCERFLDVGTGSGCIAYALAAGMPQLQQAYALEVSPEASLVAARNFAQLKQDQDTEIYLWNEDLFRLVQSPAVQLEPLDLIVSNPPYIHPEEAAAMTPQVLDHEPHLALFAPAEDPLCYYRALAQLVRLGYLRSGGSLWVELNPRYASDTLLAMCHTVGPEQCQVRLLRDLSGKERFVHLIYTPR